GDDVPRAQVVAVITLGRIAGGGAEVAIIARRSGGGVLRVARDGVGAGLLPPPRRAVTVGIGGAIPGRADVVPRDEDRAGNGVQQFSGRGIVVMRAEGDVPGSDEGD